MRQAYDYWQDQPGNRLQGSYTRSAWRRRRMTAPTVHRSTARPRWPGQMRREASDVCTFRADRVDRHFWVKPSDASSDRHTGSTVFVRQLFSWENRLVYRSQGVTDACRYPSTVGEGGAASINRRFRLCFPSLPIGYRLRAHNIGRLTHGGAASARICDLAL